MFNLLHPFIVFDWHSRFGCLSWDKITSPSNQIILSFSGQRRQRVEEILDLLSLAFMRFEESKWESPKADESRRKHTKVHSNKQRMRIAFNRGQTDAKV